MGNKLITEKDFWMCTGGLTPTQFQSTQNAAKKASGERYITKNDTATVGFADFSCKKLMWVMAIIAALIAIALVATGGAALIALGAVAGAGGALFGAVVGTLICGQVVARLRKWDNSKNNFLIQGIPTITSAHTMTCPIFGDKIIHAPQVKSWEQALAMSDAALASGVIQGAMQGMMIAGGVEGLCALMEGGSAALADGGFMQLAKYLGGNVVKNLAANSAGMNAINGLTNYLNAYGTQGQANAQDFTKGYMDSQNGNADVVKRILTGNGNADDFAFAFMMILPAGEGGEEEPKPNEEPAPEPQSEEENSDEEQKSNEEENKNNEENENNKVKTPTFEPPLPKGEEGDAYAEGGDEVILPKTKPIKAEPPFERNSNHDVNEFKKQIEGQEAGMNKLTVDEFLKNRDRYLEEGRSKEGSAEQHRYREQVRAEKVAEYRGQGYNRREANKMADSYMSDKAALHAPDQVAGGDPTNITGLGDSRINSSLGSQWKTRIDAIDAQIREQAADMTPEQRATTYLNIELPWN